MDIDNRDVSFFSISYALHRAGPQLPIVVIHSHQAIRMIHHIAVSLDIALPAVLFSYYHTLGTHPPEEVHPALATLIPFGIVALERQHHY